MRRCTILAALGVFVATALASAQPNWFRPPLRPAFPDRPEELVRTWYLRFLNREPDPGWIGWVNALRRGQAPERVLASILSSQEYFERSGRTPRGFIETLFRDLTGRRPTPRELSHWMRRLTFGSRADVAYELLMRFPQNWDTGPFRPDDWRYDYRRPNWPFRR
jgi:hypothetical protein